MLDFSSYKVLSFDCYGTLVDWETGILSALRPVLSRHAVGNLPDDELLRLYGSLEREAQKQRPFINYCEVLSKITIGLGNRLEFCPTAEDLTVLAESVKDWPPFQDTIPALRSLKQRFELAIISNVDRDLFAHSAALLEVPFDYVITSEEAKDYKPSLASFRLALERIGHPSSELLHVAQSLYHDMAPAKEMGLDTVWVNRSDARSTPNVASQPDLEVPDLKSLARLIASLA